MPGRKRAGTGTMPEPEQDALPPLNPIVRLLMRIAERRVSSSAEHRVRARQIHRILAGFPHGIGLCVKDLATGECLEYRADNRFPAVEFRELALTIDLFDQAEKGRILPTDRHALPQRPFGPGPLQSLQDQPVFSVSDYCRLMVIFRDAAAKGMIENILGRLSSCEASEGRDVRPAPCLPDTPRRLTGLLEKLALRKLISRNASDLMMEMLHLECERRRNLAAFGLPLSYKVSHSSGASPVAHAEAAVLQLPLRTVVLALFAEDETAAGQLSALDLDLLKGILRWAQALPPPPSQKPDPSASTPSHPPGSPPPMPEG